jgi:hypothetical protein
LLPTDAVGTKLITIPAGEGLIPDQSGDPDNPTVVRVVWGEFPDVTPIGLGTAADQSYFFIEPDGSLHQQTDEPTLEDVVTRVYLGFVSHIPNPPPGLDTILGVFRRAGPVANFTLQLLEMSRSLTGMRKIQGARFTQGSDLEFSMSAGEFYFFGGFPTNSIGKSTQSTPSSASASNCGRFYGEEGTFVPSPPVSQPDPTQWDNAGTLETVPNNRWTWQLIYCQPIDNDATAPGFAIQYGRQLYNGRNAALAAWPFLPTVRPDFIRTDGWVLVGAALLRGNATSWSVGRRALLFDRTADGSWSALTSDDGIQGFTTFSHHPTGDGDFEAELNEVEYVGDNLTVTLPEALEGYLTAIVGVEDLTTGITLVPDGSDTINGSATAPTLKGLQGDRWDLACNVEGDWTLSHFPTAQGRGGANVSVPVIAGDTMAASSGVGFSHFIAATNSPLFYGAANLPVGVSVNTSTGEISGSIAATGTYTIFMGATNAFGPAQEKTLVITVT